MQRGIDIGECCDDVEPADVATCDFAPRLFDARAAHPVCVGIGQERRPHECCGRGRLDGSARDRDQCQRACDDRHRRKLLAQRNAVGTRRVRLQREQQLGAQDLFGECHDFAAPFVQVGDDDRHARVRTLGHARSCKRERACRFEQWARRGRPMSRRRRAIGRRDFIDRGACRLQRIDQAALLGRDRQEGVEQDARRRPHDSRSDECQHVGQLDGIDRRQRIETLLVALAPRGKRRDVVAIPARRDGLRRFVRRAPRMELHPCIHRVARGTPRVQQLAPLALDDRVPEFAGDASVEQHATITGVRRERFEPEAIEPQRPR